MSKRSKPYQVTWSSAKTLSAVNAQLASKFSMIDEMFQTLFTTTAQPQSGDWTPTDLSGAALVFNSPKGHYIRLGPLVIASAFVTYPTTADVKTAGIGGLPFRVDIADTLRYGGVISTSDETTAARLLISSEGVINPRTTSNAAITNATLSTNILYFTVIYRTNE